MPPHQKFVANRKLADQAEPNEARLHEFLDPEERYGVLKLLSQLVLVKLTEYVNSDDIIINMVDPGPDQRQDNQQGAATYIDALLGHGKESHGCFLMNKEIAPLATFYNTADGRETKEQIWKETIKELRFANVEEVIASLS